MVGSPEITCLSPVFLPWSRCLSPPPFLHAWTSVGNWRGNFWTNWEVNYIFTSPQSWDFAIWVFWNEKAKLAFTLLWPVLWILEGRGFYSSLQLILRHSYSDDGGTGSFWTLPSPAPPLPSFLLGSWRNIWRAYRLVQETVLIRIIEAKHDCKKHKGEAWGGLPGTKDGLRLWCQFLGQF